MDSPGLDMLEVAGEGEEGQGGHEPLPLAWESAFCLHLVGIEAAFLVMSG